MKKVVILVECHYEGRVLDICDALDLQSVVTFVGHSVSCSVGILASIALPGLFNKLVLIGPNPCFVNHLPAYVGGFEKEDLEGLLALMDQNYIGWVHYLAPVVSAKGEASAVTAELSKVKKSAMPDFAAPHGHAGTHECWGIRSHRIGRKHFKNSHAFCPFL